MIRLYCVADRQLEPRLGVSRHGWLAIGLMLWICLFGNVQADALLQFVDSDGESSQILIKGAYARMDIVHPGAGRAGYLLFHADNQSLYLVDDTTGTYATFNEAMIDAQMQAMGQIIDEMRAELQFLPPELRSEMEAQMGLGLRQVPMTVEVRRSAGQQDIGGLRCVEAEIVVNGHVQSRVCVARAQDVGLSPAEFDTLNALTERLFALSRQALDTGGPMAQAMGPQVMPPLDGIPLEVRDHQDGVTTRLVGVSTDPVSPELFRIPGSYREQPSP